MREVGVRIAGRVATITIDRPGSRNAIGLATIGQLDEALDEVAAADCSVLMLRGAGDRAFISGGDLKELSAIRDEAGAIAMASRMRQLLDRLSRSRSRSSPLSTGTRWAAGRRLRSPATFDWPLRT